MDQLNGIKLQSASPLPRSRRMNSGSGPRRRGIQVKSRSRRWRRGNTEPAAEDRDDGTGKQKHAPAGVDPAGASLRGSSGRLRRLPGDRRAVGEDGAIDKVSIGET